MMDIKKALNGIYDILEKHNEINRDVAEVLEQNKQEYIKLLENMEDMNRRVEEIENQWGIKNG